MWVAFVFVLALMLVLAFAFGSAFVLAFSSVRRPLPS